MNEDIGTFFAPITLLIGGALIAAGLLSFLDLNYFKTKLRPESLSPWALPFCSQPRQCFSPAAERALFGWPAVGRD